MNILIDHRIIVDTLMLSPFYWILTIKERLYLVKHILKLYEEGKGEIACIDI